VTHLYKFINLEMPTDLNDVPLRVTNLETAGVFFLPNKDVTGDILTSLAPIFH
jgi:hypothetical protein